MGQHDYEYIKMKKMLENMRRAGEILNEEIQPNPHILGDKSGELETAALQTDKDSKKISLDDGKEATIVTDDNNELPGNITLGLQTILNGFMTAINGTVLQVDMVTVNIGDSSVNIIIKLIMEGEQSLTVDINSATKDVQLKYDNFLKLSDETQQMVDSIKRYFNPKLLTQLQGLVGQL